LTCTVTGLNPGTRYTFSVVAQNSRGTSVPSTSASIVAVKTTTISSFRHENSTLTAALKDQVAALARDIAKNGYKQVSLFGYSNNGADSALSVARARSVQSFLGLRLTELKVRRVAISVAGGQSTTKFTTGNGTNLSGNNCVVASLS
jgi:outer membrane protein OmpA-like peptidoglycan-associated protein